MATLNDYFRTEARDFLNALERSLQRTPAPDAAELHQAVRGLRGTAQMAREQRIFDVVSAFEAVTRAIADGALTWSDSVAASARDTIADLRVLLDPAEDEEQLDARVNAAAARWRKADPDSAPVAAAPTIDADTREFREFAAREAAAIADALDHGVGELQTDPMNREPLTTILRRQRALLGSARLEEIPVIADILRAVEDLTRVIVKLDVGVKQEWLDIYRVARDALQTTIAPLLRDELPQSSNSISRLRHMRAELLERYGTVAEASPPTVDPLAASGTLPANLSGHTPPLSAGAMQPASDASGDHARPSATLPGDPRPPRSGSVPAAPFMGPARSTPRPPAGPSAQAPPMSSAAPGAPPVSTRSAAAPGDVLELQESSVVDGDTSTHAGASAADAHMETLELGNDEIVDQGEGVLELGEDTVVEDEAAMLELGEDTVVEDEAAMLELGEDTVIDDEAAMLELGEDTVVDEGDGVLELGDNEIVDESAGVLELDEGAGALDAGVAAETGVLELIEGAGDDDARMLDLSSISAVDDENGLLQLDDGGLDDEEAGLIEFPDEEPSTPTDARFSGPVYSREEALRRALELRDVIAGVAAHDPRAREAVDELFALLKTALG